MDIEDFNSNLIIEMLHASWENCLSKQPDLFVFTGETIQSEWNLAHHFSIEVASAFEGFDCDFDVIKVNFGRRRPDIVIHKRGRHDKNLLVIEVKKRPDEMEGDLDKIRKYWFQSPLSYRYGASVAIAGDSSIFINVIENSRI